MIKVSSSYALLEGTEQTCDGRLQHQTTHLSLHGRADRLQLCVFIPIICEGTSPIEYFFVHNLTHDNREVVLLLADDFPTL